MFGISDDVATSSVLNFARFARLASQSSYLWMFEGVPREQAACSASMKSLEGHLIGAS